MLGPVATFGRELARGLFQLLYPGVCNVCGMGLAPDTAHVCGSCRTLITHDPYGSCPRCAATVGPFVNVEGGCPHCRDYTLHFERAIRLGPYEGLLRDVILRLKYQGGEMLAENVGQLWAETAAPRLREFGAEVVVPIPLHWWRHWTRGYNQSGALARALAAHLSLPFRPRWLRRIRNTPMQTQQTPSGRRENVRGAFRARSSSNLRGKTVLLVDDVLTTGSTCSEAARALRDAGAARVVVAVLAHSRG